MAGSTKADVMYALLALDAYNRHADPLKRKISDQSGEISSQIGDATWLESSDRKEEDSPSLAGSQTAGFSASSYNLNGQKVISYRGTDFDFSTWEGVEPFLPDPLYAQQIREQFLMQFARFSDSGIIFADALKTEVVDAFVEAIWSGFRPSDGNGGADTAAAHKAIDRFHFRVPADTYEIVMSDRSYQVKDGHGEDVHIDAYHGSEENDVVYSTLGNDLIFVNEGDDKVFLRGGRDYVQAGEGFDTLVDRVTVNTQHSPSPDNVPGDAKFDDIFVGLTADEDETPWQMLLKAYASEEFFKNADEYRYSVAKEPERLQVENAGANDNARSTERIAA